MSEKNGFPTGKHTLVEEGTEFRGTMSSNCPIVVMGKVEGDVAGPEIHVSPTGVIAGNVKVKELRSEGEVAGEVEAQVVHISGRVRDKTVIRARRSRSRWPRRRAACRSCSATASSPSATSRTRRRRSPRRRRRRPARRRPLRPARPRPSRRPRMQGRPGQGRPGQGEGRARGQAGENPTAAEAVAGRQGYGSGQRGRAFPPSSELSARQAGVRQADARTPPSAP